MYQSKLKNPMVDDLFSALSHLETEEDYYRFFEDVCTISELQAIAQRFAVVKRLAKAQTYTEIGLETGASTATISRVKKSLHYGADGYKLVLEKMGLLKKEN